MQKNILFILCLATILISGSCKEISPEYRLVRPQDGQRNVLIEEFTGVQCVNCPQGTDEIVNLQGLYGKNLISVAIHAGFFAMPFNDSKYDFVTQEGKAIQDWLGAPIGYPAAVINRTKFPNEDSYQLFRPKWPNYIATLTQTVPELNVIASTTFDPESRQIKIVVTVEALTDINRDTRINVMLTEDNIIDPQYNTTGKITEYRHRHVLRSMLTNFDGNFLSANMKFGDKLTKEYSYTLPAENGWWNADNLHVVAFVTDASSNAPGEVLNVTEVSINK